MFTFEQIPEHDILTVEQVGQQSYNELLSLAKQRAQEIKLGDYTYQTFSLLEDLREHDEDAALGGLRTFPIAMDIADEVNQFQENSIDMRWQFVVSLLHDIGKVDLPKALLEKSTRGEAWDEKDMQATRPHAERGGLIMMANGFPIEVQRAVAGHHSKQLYSDEYGLEIPIDDDARVYRDCTALADFIEAAENRTNTRNCRMSTMERRCQGAVDMVYVLGEYAYSSELVPQVVKRTLGMQALFSQLELVV